MAIEPRSILKNSFITGHVPTQQEYWDVLDSYMHLEDDNVTIYPDPGTGKKNLGIGTLQPEAPLGITATGVDEKLISFNHADEANAAWFFDLDPGNLGNPGFNIDQVVGTGKVSRFFIQESDGYIGIGTTTPDQQLHIERSTGQGVTGVQLINTATVANNGFILGHGHSAITEQDGAFSIFENTAIDGNNRFTIRAGGKVGINELMPDTKLHVSADVSLGTTPVDLFPGTGILTIGPITDNIVADFQSVQKRTGSYDANGVLSLGAGTLNLQPLGGDIIIHGDMDVIESSKIMIAANARIGIGTLTPGESIHSIGAMILGSSIGQAEGTIRFTGTDFEGFKQGVWYSMTGSAPPPPFTPWVQGPANSIYYLAPSNSRVGIGTNTPDCPLDIDDGESDATSNTAATIYNHAQSSDPIAAGNRINTRIFNNGVWPSGGKNIGLYVSEVIGVTENESNIAAVLNGNVAIGDVSSSEFLGAGASRVLSIQNGTAPAPPSGGVNAISVQIYSQDLAGTTIPTLHILRANGQLIKLYTETGLTAGDNTIISEVSYGATEAAVINNLRTRLNELEGRLMNHGLLGNPVPVP